MSYDTAYQRVRGILDTIPAIASITDGRIPFVSKASPLAMIESAGSTGITPDTRKGQTLHTWWRFRVRVAVPIIDTTEESIAETESALRDVNQGLLDTFMSERSVRVGDVDADNERESWVNVNGSIYRVGLVLIEIQDRTEY